MSGSRQQAVTSWQQVVVMEFEKRHNRHNGLALANLLRTCCVLSTGKLRGN